MECKKDKFTLSGSRPQRRRGVPAAVTIPYARKAPPSLGACRASGGLKMPTKGRLFRCLLDGGDV
jgi:hypothetical protein